MILTAFGGIGVVIFQILALCMIPEYGVTSYEYLIAQVVTFCWAMLLLFSEIETKEDNNGTHQ